MARTRAQAPCANQEIVVEAKPLEVDYRNNNAVLRDVVITQCDMRIEAAEARVTGGLDFENSHWTISGDVRIKAEGGSLRSDKAIVAVPQQAHLAGHHHRRARGVRAAARRRHHLARPRQHHRLRNRQRHGELPRRMPGSPMAATKSPASSWSTTSATQSVQGQARPAPRAATATACASSSSRTSRRRSPRPTDKEKKP